MSSEPRRYARRRVNPFLGVLQVIDTPGGRALSPDGVNWEIQLYTERPAGRSSLNAGTMRRVLYRYGAWSAEGGLTCFPAPPTVNRAEARNMGDTLVAAMRDSIALLPFPLMDRYELWLLDDSPDAAPLALLDTAIRDDGIDFRRGRTWVCAPGLAVADRVSLSTQVRAQAGQSARARWFRREPDGTGVEMGDTAPGASPRRLPSDHFPELLIREHWPQPEEQARADAYIARQAPRLLMLPLAPATRARLERAATTQALVVDRFHRLYPEIADDALIVRLRVEACLRRGRMHERVTSP